MQPVIGSFDSAWADRRCCPRETPVCNALDVLSLIRGLPVACDEDAVHPSQNGPCFCWVSAPNVSVGRHLLQRHRRLRDFYQTEQLPRRRKSREQDGR